MSHEWHKGTLTASSWHGLETLGTMPDAVAMLHRGYESGAWPTRIERAAVRARLDDGRELVSPADKAIVAHYDDGHPSAIVGTVGRRFRELACQEWRELIETACDAGARPTGAFALSGGSKVLATFEVATQEAGAAGKVATQLVLCDSFDGSTKLLAGTSSIRVVCANTLSAALRSDGAGFGRLRHTASMADRLPAMHAAIDGAIREGSRVVDLMARASERKLARDEAEHVFDKLFPRADEDASPHAKTRAANERQEARWAMARPENDLGGTLGTLWNTATWLIDRESNGRARQTRGGDRLESMLLGSRAERVAEVQTIIEVMMRDGSVQHVPAPDALAMGVPPEQVGRSIIADMLGEALS